MTRLILPRAARHRGQVVTLAVLLLLGLVQVGAWWAMSRPSAPPDVAGRIGGFAFAPYQRGQSAEGERWPSPAEIESDLRAVAPLTDRIRTYTVQRGFDAIPALAARAGLDLRVTLGAWLDGDAGRDNAEITRLIAAARGRANVDGVLVGNEAVLRGDVSAAALVERIGQVRRARLGVPVSTAEPWHVWLDHPELAAAVDVITVHLLPYWEGLPIDASLRYVLDRYEAIRARFPGKPVVIGEVGWPSDGRDIGAARASRVNQAEFLRRFFVEAERRDLRYYVMEAFDQPWKVAFEGRAGAHWGMFDVDRDAKWPLAGPVQEVPDWPLWAGGASLLAFAASLFLLARRPDIRLPGKLLVAALAQAFVAGITLVLLRMTETYLPPLAAAVWGAMLLGQLLLLALLLADGFELAETIWGSTWRRRHAPLPAPAGTPLPKVSLHLPICNEPPELVRRTLLALAELDYPDFEVLVVDNNTTDPALWQPVADACARLGPRFRFFHLGRWPGFKAGALNFALRETAADATIIGVLDSDYVVERDWLARMVPFFSRAEVGFTQSPQDYRDGAESVFKRLMFWEYAGFFRCGMVTRNERNAIIQHGTMTLIRRTAMERLGGWAEWCICEDSELGLRLMRDGWEAVYSPQSFGRGVMPDDFAAYRKQRFRWAYGAMQIMKRHWRALLNPWDRSLTQGQRYHFVAGWAPWIGDALGLLFVGLGLWWSIGLIAMPLTTRDALDLPSLRAGLAAIGLSDEFPIALFMLPSLGLFAFKLAQVWSLYAARVPCGAGDRLGAALAGLALSPSIGRAVLFGLFTNKAPFLRTPKLADAPALVQGLVMARFELVVAGLIWAAAAGVAAVHQLSTREAVLWTAVLLVQSVPFVAAVTVSLIAAWPARRVAVVAPTAGVPSMAGGGALPASQPVGKAM